ncbi:hypothetical protein [Thermus aquaticus]|nr:hypothetical protein [Thermus aquaticus]
MDAPFPQEEALEAFFTLKRSRLLIPLQEVLSARTLVSQHGVPESGLWRGFSGALTAAKAAVGYLGGIQAEDLWAP